MTTRVLVTVEWKNCIPILSKFKQWLSDLKARVKLTDSCAKPMRMIKTSHTRKASKSNLDTTLLDVIDYIERWISSRDGVDTKPTWRNFFKIMKDISSELDQPIYQMKELFNGMYNNIIVSISDSSSILTKHSLFLSGRGGRGKIHPSPSCAYNTDFYRKVYKYLNLM